MHLDVGDDLEKLLGLLSGGRLLSPDLDGLILLGRGSLLNIVTIARGPQGQVVTQKLHDQSGIPVALFTQGIEFRNGVIESLLGQVAGTVGRIENLVVEH